MPAATPIPIRKLLRRCLERDRKRRLHDIADARLEIDEALSAPVEAPAFSGHTASHSRLRTLFPWFIAALVSAAWLSSSLWRTTLPDVPNLHVLLAPPEKAVFTPVQPNTGGMAISPDGRTLAFVATQEGRTFLWVRRLDSLDARPLPRTDNAFFPFWSPDNRSIGFFAEGKLKKIELAGGTPQVICDATGLARGATWNREGVIVFAGNTLQSGSVFNTDARVSETLPPTNIRMPESISYSTTPKAQISARLSATTPRACSGLM